MEQEYIIFDTEFTSWDGAQENDWAEPWQEKEIVQISAIKIKDNKVVDSFDCLVRPSKNPLLSEYFTNLTGITNEQVQENAIGFKQAYINFIEFAKGYVCYSNSTGSDEDCKGDGEILHINLDLNNIDQTEGIEYKNISPIIYDLAKNNDIKLPALASGEFAGYLGLEEVAKKMAKIGSVHYALYDCYSLFVTLQHLRNL